MTTKEAKVQLQMAYKRYQNAYKQNLSSEVKTERGKELASWRKVLDSLLIKGN